MNDMLKNIRGQLKPDEETVSELMKKIENPESVQVAVKKLMFAIPAAACAAVCIALFLFSRSDKPQTKETAELSSPDSVLEQIETTPDNSVRDIAFDSKQEQTAQENQTETFKLKLTRCNADEIIIGDESAEADFSDEKQKQAFLEANKQIEFDGTVYGFVKECDDNSGDIANLSCNIGKDSEWAAASFAYISDKKRIAVYNAKRPSGHYYIFENTDETESEMTGIAVNWQAGYIFPAYGHFVVNEQLNNVTSAALDFLSEKNNVEYNGEMYAYTGLYDGEFTGDPAPAEFDVNSVFDGYGTIDVLYSDGGTSKIYFCYYQSDDKTLLAQLIDGSVIKFEKDNTVPVTVPVPELRGMTAEEAKAALDECGLGYAAENREDEGESGRVIDQSIAAGEEVSIGSTVTIYVSISPEEQQEKPYTVNSAVITVSEVFSEDSEVYREEIMRLISEEEKHAQLSAAKSFKFNGETYEYCGSSAEKDCISTGTETSRIIGKGSINVDGDISKIWFCSVGSEPTEKKIAVDLGDWKGVIFENKSYKVPEKTDVSLTLYKSDYPIDTRTDEYIEYSFEDTLKIFDALGEIEFDGRKYKFTGDITDDVVFDYIAIGTIKYNGRSNSIYGAYRPGYPEGEQLLIDLGNWRYCVMQAVE